MLDFEKMTVNNHEKKKWEWEKRKDGRRRYVGQVLVLGALALLSGGVLLAGLVWNVAMGNGKEAVNCGVLMLMAVGTALIVGRDALEMF